MVLVYNNDTFPIINDFTTTKSSREVTYSDISIDFTGHTIEELPLKYQEVRIMDMDEGTILYTGFVDSFSPPTLKNDWSDLIVNFTLISPMKMATVRSNTVIGTFKLESLFRRILTPLFNDGFYITELNINTESQCTVSFGLETIEYMMNNLSNRLNIWWYIDEYKGIHINSIDYIVNKPSVLTLDNKTDFKELGLENITPSIESYEYANVINIKNARVYTEMSQEGIAYTLMLVDKTIKAGDTYDFNFPVDISKTNLETIKEDYNLPLTVDGIFIQFANDVQAYVRLDENGNYVMSNNVSLSTDSEEKLVVLQVDSFFKNLITGFKFNGTANTSIKYIHSNSALKPSVIRFYNNEEIQKNKGIISDTGIVEAIVNVNEKWFTEKQLIEYCGSLMTINGNETSIIKLQFDKNPNLDIGNLININLPKFLTKGSFILTDISFNKKVGIDNEVWKLSLRNSNLTENYIDMFRRTAYQEEESMYDDIVVAEYSEDNIINRLEVEKIEN